VYFKRLKSLIQVDAAVVEVGVGGEYDSTNIIPKPTCAGVTSLGIDHVDKLGNTLESIAWHKSGIFKSGVAALTVQQPPEALEVLRQRAEEKHVNTYSNQANDGPYSELFLFTLL
jgi:folylpolyglutamate synthase